jgi:uncharacterized repeat protein (TIGR03803 family)
MNRGRLIPEDSFYRPIAAGHGGPASSCHTQARTRGFKVSMRPPFSAGSTVLALGIALLTGCGGDSGGGDPGQQQFTRHDGQGPVALIQVTDGNFYGVTAEGGDFGFGSVFRITPEGEELVLYSFAGGPEDGGNPQSLMEATDGNFYGTTSSGGCCGAVFKLTPEGSEAILYFFKGKADGGTPPPLGG